MPIEDANVTFNREYKDDVTGFTGKATGHIKYMAAESQVKLEATRSDGSLAGEWFPVGRLSFTS